MATYWHRFWMKRNSVHFFVAFTLPFPLFLSLSNKKRNRIKRGRAVKATENSRGSVSSRFWHYIYDWMSHFTMFIMKHNNLAAVVNYPRNTRDSFYSITLLLVKRREKSTKQDLKKQISRNLVPLIDILHFMINLRLQKVNNYRYLYLIRLVNNHAGRNLSKSTLNSFYIFLEQNNIFIDFFLKISS